MDQTSASATKPGTSSQAVNLDPPHPRPRPTSQSAEAMEVDYGPALPPPLGADHLMITHWISFLVYPMNLLRWHLLDPKNILTLTKSMTLNRGPPRISIQVSPRNLGLPHLDLKSMLVEVNTK